MTSWPASSAGPDQPTWPLVKMTHRSAMARARWTNCSLRTIVMPGLAGLLEALEDRFGDERCQAERHLVGDDQLGGDGERPGQGQHLLLAAREAARRAGCGAAEDGEAVDRPVDGRRPVPATLLGHGHAQVVDDREAGEDAAPLGDVRQPELADPVRGQPGDVTTVEADTTGDRPHESRYRARPACSCPRRSRRGRRAPIRPPTGQRNAEEGLRRAVADVEVLDLEDGVAHRASPSAGAGAAEEPAQRAPSGLVGTTWLLCSAGHCRRDTPHGPRGRS